MDRVKPDGRARGVVEPPGLAVRRVALAATAEVLAARPGANLDDALDNHGARLDPRDASLARAIAVATFRHLGAIHASLAARLERGVPEGRAFALLATGAAQILHLDVPDHAAVDLAVRLAGESPDLARLAGLVNAVLRRLARERDSVLAEATRSPLLAGAPPWLADRWEARYGPQTARAIAAAHARGGILDVTVRDDPEGWAVRLGGVALPTGSVRVAARVPVPELPGFAEGAWWVQDAAAALPARLLAAKPGERVADLCAAPGGKTAQLAATGAEVVAVDRSAPRLARLQANLDRLGLKVETRALDALALPEERFDAVLVDAPCTATGTLRRHPDVAWTKTPEDLARLAGLQARLLDRAARLLGPGGRLVTCTCSLEPEEGEKSADNFLRRHPDFALAPIRPEEVGGEAGFVTADGQLRTLPSDWPERGGLDGFFAARFVRGH